MARQALVLLLVVLAFGILVPFLRGYALLDPRVIAAYACMALLFVAPASAELSLHPTPASRGAVLGRICMIVGYGWGIAVMILITAMVTINLTNWQAGFIRPPFVLGAAVLLFSLTASIAVAELGAILARRFSAAGVKAILRTGFLLVLLAFAFGSRILPERWQLVIFDHTSTRRAMTHLAWSGSAAAALLSAILLIPLLKKTAVDSK